MKSGTASVVEGAAVLSRWLVGGLFIYMGLAKAVHPVDFLKLVRQYDLVQTSWMLNGIAAMLPWFEVFCGLLLLTGIAVRGTAAAMLAMLVPFTAVVIHRALGLQSQLGLSFCAVKFDCGCGAGEVYICHKIAENTLLVLVSLWLLSGRGRWLALRHSLRSLPGASLAPGPSGER